MVITFPNYFLTQIKEAKISLILIFFVDFGCIPWLVLKTGMNWNYPCTKTSIVFYQSIKYLWSKSVLWRSKPLYEVSYRIELDGKSRITSRYSVICQFLFSSASKLFRILWVKPYPENRPPQSLFLHYLIVKVHCKPVSSFLVWNHFYEKKTQNHGQEWNFAKF